MGRTRRDAPRRSIPSVVALLVLAAATGCGSSNDPGTGAGGPSTTQASGSSLSLEQATRLSGALAGNAAAKGASVRLTSTAAGETVEMHGTVSWVDGRGELEVDRTGNADLDPYTVTWGGSTVIEQHPDLAGPTAWVARSAAPDQVLQDWLLRVVSKLASRTRDNPSLVQQADASFVRKDAVGGAAVEVFRYSRALYWIDGKGALLRFQVDTKGKIGQTTISLSDFGPQTVHGPVSASVAALSAVLAPYASLTGTTVLLAGGATAGDPPTS